MRAFVVHGHFYQPFRENPYIGEIPIEFSAFPFENWNERIYRECYLPNAYAHYRVGEKTANIVNNYKHMSFNMGWTLLYWLQDKHPQLLEKIKEGLENTIATSFNHTILPLDPDDDKLIQILWGIRAYEHFFGRKPKGFWLPELAVDKKTLRMLAQLGIKYTILAPHQVVAKSNFIRVPIEDNYIDVFVYDGALSHQITFERALEDAKGLLNNLYHREGLTLIALDGETFGHHKKFGEMGLAYMFTHSSHFTTLEDYYDLHKPEHFGDIVENTSWSCSHGVERWRNDCGCSTGGEAGWHQKWRKPLRKGLEYVREKVKEKVYNQLENYLKDSYKVILDFIDVILGKSKEEFLKEHAKKSLSHTEKVEIFRYLNAIKYIQLSFSSDGWFFADISGLETIKNLLFAKRAIELAQVEYVEAKLLEYLQQAPSNKPEIGNGKKVWMDFVLSQVYKPYQIAKGIHFLSKETFTEKTGKLGKWIYTIEDESVKLLDTETFEEYSYRDFDESLEDIPDVLLRKLQELYFYKYAKERTESFGKYRSFWKFTLKKADDLPFPFADFIKDEYTNYLRCELYVTVKENSPIDKVKEIVKQAQDLGISVIDEHIASMLSSYVLEKLKVGSEEEILDTLEFVQKLNSTTKDYKKVINLWEAQNYLWENRNRFRCKRIFHLLNLIV